jgi:hypothetical protein
MSKESQVPEDEPKQKTHKGKEIPLPKREQVMQDFRKIVKGKKP